MGIDDPRRVYRTEEMASGDVLFAATGVTDGNMLDGVTFQPRTATTHTVVTRSRTGTQRWVKTVHRIGGPTGSVD
jgi:fructose-1,6-bisphosphatase II / sedoheptulose-1,7-bisphosphatase